MRLLRRVVTFVADMYSFIVFVYKLIFRQKFKRIKRETPVRPIYILGNGPSLKKILSMNHDRVNYSVMAVNFSVDSDLYYMLKPEYHVLADDGFMNLRDVRISSFWQNVTKNISWPITFFVKYTLSQEIKDICCPNKNIRFEFLPYSSWIPETKVLKPFSYKLMMMGYNTPCIMNVLVGAIMASIIKGFKDISLFGVDHSWTKNLFVNDENKLCIYDEHFYDGQKRNYVYCSDGRGGTEPTYVFLGNLSVVFKSYFAIRELIDYYGNIRIINRTKGSFIDAFERSYE